jgi:hypothetical protein
VRVRVVSDSRILLIISMMQSPNKRTLKVDFAVVSSEPSLVSAHVKLQVLLPEEALSDAEAHACITEQHLVDAVRKHMRVLLTPSDDADLHQLSETARAIEANLGEACAREYMENTLAAYGSGRFFCTMCADEGASRWRIRRCADEEASE